MRRFNIKMDGQVAALTVAEKGSYSAAGKLLQMTTSAVRKQVESVGAKVGAPIFQRLGNRLRISPAFFQRSYISGYNSFVLKGIRVREQYQFPKRICEIRRNGGSNWDLGD
jgi:hypothetical protein